MKKLSTHWPQPSVWQVDWIQYESTVQSHGPVSHGAIHVGACVGFKVGLFVGASIYQLQIQ